MSADDSAIPRLYWMVCSSKFLQDSKLEVSGGRLPFSIKLSSTEYFQFFHTCARFLLNDGEIGERPQVWYTGIDHEFWDKSGRYSQSNPVDTPPCSCLPLRKSLTNWSQMSSFFPSGHGFAKPHNVGAELRATFAFLSPKFNSQPWLDRQDSHRVCCAIQINCHARITLVEPAHSCRLSTFVLRWWHQRILPTLPAPRDHDWVLLQVLSFCADYKIQEQVPCLCAKPQVWQHPPRDSLPHNPPASLEKLGCHFQHWCQNRKAQRDSFHFIIVGSKRWRQWTMQDCRLPSAYSPTSQWWCPLHYAHGREQFHRWHCALP